MSFLGERIDSLHVSLQKAILVRDLVLHQILELLHLDLDDDFIDVRIAASLIFDKTRSHIIILGG